MIPIMRSDNSFNLIAYSLDNKLLSSLKNAYKNRNRTHIDAAQESLN